jgi:hypothetical protein
MKLKLNNDELIVWKSPAHMIMKGEVVIGEIMVTNKSISFAQREEKRFLSSNNKMNDLWELELNRIQDVNMHRITGIMYPMVRIRYRENEVFFTFPDREPTQTITALIVFINHAMLIERIMGLMKNMERGLDSGSLKLGEKVPNLMVDLPHKADEGCFQCGKILLDEEIDKLSEDVRECLSCIPEMH